MIYNRRFFLKAASAAAAGTLVWPLASCSQSGNQSDGSADSLGTAGSRGSMTTIPDFGIQLYSARDIIGKDPRGVLKQLADMGYKKVESYQGDQGVFWGMSPKEFKGYLDELRMTAVSTHADTTKDLEKLADEAAEAGLTYVLQPYIGAQPSLDEWKKRAEEFNQRGEVCKKAGVKFGYHNHDYSFRAVDGQVPQELLLESTDPGLVVYELDILWIEAAGVDAETHFKKYAGRYDLCHIKDLVREPEPHSTDLGQGQINYAKVLRTAADNGVKHFIVEQEHYPESVLKSLANDADYMKQLVLQG
ncbi:sugar phosphate isomerase/epimerase [Rhabdobacter roseus]|uniref:Sugar phosphate isomerase/epimerase n=1 Tax=Rhabdobacter roseus TaxID=1655419 RepID=A0A840TV50_9BACT|nr:sugar phosphate isomerase/epimerase [Rhabdobacter roseus]MBB5283549.1 sugar phosphate isomerase/epimerase [Rhabdobacter roseus]